MSLYACVEGGQARSPCVLALGHAHPLWAQCLALWLDASP